MKLFFLLSTTTIMLLYYYVHVQHVVYMEWQVFFWKLDFNMF